MVDVYIESEEVTIQVDEGSLSKYRKCFITDEALPEGTYVVYDWVNDEWIEYNDELKFGYICSSGEKGYFSGDDFYYIDEAETCCASYVDLDDLGYRWCRNRDGYYSRGFEEDEEDDSDDHTISYHGARRQDFSNNSEWKVGLEIEKEDESVKEDVYHRNLYDKYGWSKERDGSLNEDSGFELISPIYDLYGDKMLADIQSYDLLKCINANKSSACGFHLNISNKTLSEELVTTKDSFKATKELFKKYFSNYTLLFYALYQERTTGEYSKKKKNKEYLFASKDKYSAFNFKRECLEIRIFKAIENINELLWNIKLIKHIIENPIKNSLSLFSDVKLKQLIEERHDYNEIVTAMLEESSYKETTIEKLKKKYNIKVELKIKLTPYSETETGIHNYKEELKTSYMVKCNDDNQILFDYDKPLFYFGKERKYGFIMIRESKSGNTWLYGNNKFLELYKTIK
jgi:hypothetical protein